MSKGFFVSGTDTDVGKTIVSAVLINKLNADYFKPIQCGLNKLKKKDSDTIKTLCKNTNVLKEIYFFRDPVSPYVASLREKKNIDIKKIISFKKNCTSEKLIIEGAGGLYVPIKKNFFMSDLSKKMNLPMVLVSRTKLGTINHTLMSLEIIKRQRINFFGIIFIGENEMETIDSIDYFGKKILKKKINIIGRLPFVKKISINKIKYLSTKIVI